MLRILTILLTPERERRDVNTNLERIKAEALSDLNYNFYRLN